MPRDKDPQRCVAREPLLYGSLACENLSTKYGDLCGKHARLIAPNQLIGGILYLGRDEDE